jgi:hypothetical protein
MMPHLPAFASDYRSSSSRLFHDLTSPWYGELVVVERIEVRPPQSPPSKS